MPKRIDRLVEQAEDSDRMAEHAKKIDKARANPKVDRLPKPQDRHPPPPKNRKK